MEIISKHKFPAILQSVVQTRKWRSFLIFPFPHLHIQSITRRVITPIQLPKYVSNISTAFHLQCHQPSVTTVIYEQDNSKIFLSSQPILIPTRRIFYKLKWSCCFLLQTPYLQALCDLQDSRYLLCPPR